MVLFGEAFTKNKTKKLEVRGLVGVSRGLANVPSFLVLFVKASLCPCNSIHLKNVQTTGLLFTLQYLFMLFRSSSTERFRWPVLKVLLLSGSMEDIPQLYFKRWSWLLPWSHRQPKQRRVDREQNNHFPLCIHFILD